MQVLPLGVILECRRHVRADPALAPRGAPYLFRQLIGKADRNPFHTFIILANHDARHGQPIKLCRGPGEPSGTWPQPYQDATATAAGYSHTYRTNGSGYALIYLNGPPPGARITVTVGGATCTTSD